MSKIVKIWFNQYYPKDDTVHEYNRTMSLIRSRNIDRIINTTNPLVFTKDIMEEYDIVYHINSYDGKITIIDKNSILSNPDLVCLRSCDDFQKALKDNRLANINSELIYLEYIKSGENINEDDYYRIIANDDLEAFKEIGIIEKDIVVSCAYKNAINIAKYVIEEEGAWADYDSPGTARNTPFKAACEHGHLDFAKYLFDNCNISLNYLNITLESCFIGGMFEEKSSSISEYLDSLHVPYTKRKTMGEMPG